MSSSSSSSLRQHQRRSAIVPGGHSPLARNHSAGTPVQPPHHSSSISFTTQRSSRSLPSPTTTTTTTTTAYILHEDDDVNNQLNEKISNNIFNFEHKINNFHNSSINQNINEINIPRSTRLLCGSIIPLQASTSSPNIDHRPLENDHSTSPIFSPLPFRKSDLKYRSHFLFLLIKILLKKIRIKFYFFYLEIWDVMVYEYLN
jgi:hypothetical protein